jgi:hypothetical protein
MAHAAPKPAGSEGVRSKVPDWLAALGIKEREYFTTSKLREQRASKARCISEAGRVHACLGLHTMGYQQQLAVKMKGGQRVPLSPADVATETGIRRDHVIRAMAQLKIWGLVDWEGSTKGQMKMYAWAVPRPVIRKEDCTQVGYNPEIPPFIVSLLKRYKIKPKVDFVPAHGYITAVEEAARVVDEASRAVKEAEIVLKRVLNCTHAREELYPNSERIYKEERNERNEERESSSTFCIDSYSKESTSAAKPNGAPKPEPLKEATTTTKPQEPPPEKAEKPKYKSERDELVALIKDSTGQIPDQRLLTDIQEAVELKWGSLRAYIDKVRPTVKHLKKPPGPGYFRFYARNPAQSASAPPPQTVDAAGRCSTCHGIGRIAGGYCACPMGQDIERVERRMAKQKQRAP